MRRRAKPAAALIAWMNLSDLRSALRWPFDHCCGNRGAANDDDLVYWNGTWTRRTNLAAVKSYWKRLGFPFPKKG